MLSFYKHFVNTPGPEIIIIKNSIIFEKENFKGDISWKSDFSGF